MRIFAERLKDLRKEKKLSQYQLAEKVGVTQTAINLWELNKREPKLSAVSNIADFFDVSLDFLAGRTDKF